MMIDFVIGYFVIIAFLFVCLMMLKDIKWRIIGGTGGRGRIDLSACRPVFTRVVNVEVAIHAYQQPNVICTLTLDNDYKVRGESKETDSEARASAYLKLEELERFMTCERIHRFYR